MKTHPVAMCTRQDDKPLVEVNWKREDMKGKPLSSIYLLDHSSSTQQDYLKALKRNPKVIAQFVSKLSKTFHARLLSVHKDPLTLVLCHKTADDFRYLTENRQALIELIRELIPYQDNAGRLELKVSFHGGEGDTKYGGRSKRLMDTGKHYRNQTLSELGFEASEVAEIDQQLECISKKLSKQRENFDSRLQSQNEKLEIVRNEIDKITQRRQRQLDETQIKTHGEREASSLNYYLSTGEQTSSHEKRSTSLAKQTLFPKKQTLPPGTWSSTNEKQSSSLEKQSSSHGKQLPSLEKQSPSLSKVKRPPSFEVSPSDDQHPSTGELISSNGKQPSSIEKEPMSHEKQVSSQEMKSLSLENQLLSQPNVDRSFMKRSESSDKQSTLKEKPPPDSQEKLTSEGTSTLGAGNATEKNAHDVVLPKSMRTRNEDSVSLNGHIDDRDEYEKDTQPNELVNQDEQEDKFKTIENENCNNGYDRNEGEDDFDDDDDDDSDDGEDDTDDDDDASGDDEEYTGENDSDDNDEETEDVIDELQKAIEDLIQRRARGEDRCSTPRTPDPYSFRSNSGLFTSPSQLEHVLLRMGMDVTKETHPKLEVEHAAICVLNHFRDVILSNVDDRIWRMVDMAIENEPTPVPRSETSFDTILCLDNFGAMSRESLSSLKEIALDFINGIEDIADEYGLEENIAVVALGSSPQILHHLSIDYDSIRETIENLGCGAYESLAYLKGVLMSLAVSTRASLPRYVDLMSWTGGVCDLGGYLRVPPRLVVITDGFILGKTEGCKTEVETLSTFTAFAQLQVPFIRQNIFGDVIVVPNGPVNENVLSVYIKKCKGRLVNDIACLCNNQRLKRHAAQILKYIDSQCGSNRSTATSLLQIVQAFTAGFTQTEKSEIANIVKERYDPEVPTAYSVNTYENIHEESTLPPLGSRVIRGPDWPGKDEDGNGPGTVINHEPDKVNLWVLWDNNVLLYRHRYGLGYYDVCPVEDHPMLPDESDLVLRIGMQVERGPDWHESYGDQDGGPGSYGTVIRYNYLRVMVRWNNGEMHEYRFGENGRYDLIIRSCYDKAKDYKTERKQVVSGAGSRPKYATCGKDTTERRQRKKEVHSNTTSPQYTPTRWYWQDPDGSWIPYSHGDNEKLIKTYTRRPDGSCLIKRDGENYRVLFKTLEEKPIDKTKGGDSRNVRFE